MPDEVEFSAVVVQPEEDRPYLVAVLVDAVPAHHAVGVTPVFPFDPLPFVLEVDAVELFADDPVAAGRLEFGEPAGGFVEILGHGSEVPGEAERSKELRQPLSPLPIRNPPQVFPTLGQEVEGNELCRALLGQQLDSGPSRMDP